MQPIAIVTLQGFYPYSRSQGYYGFLTKHSMQRELPTVPPSQDHKITKYSTVKSI